MYQLEFIWCREGGKIISDDEYVVNWGSCSDCFDKHYFLYCELNPEQLELYESKDWQAKRESESFDSNP